MAAHCAVHKSSKFKMGVEKRDQNVEPEVRELAMERKNLQVKTKVRADLKSERKLD